MSPKVSLFDTSKGMNDSYQITFGFSCDHRRSLGSPQVIGIVARICSEYELWVECEGSIDFFLTVKPVGARLGARKVKPIDLP